jgi:phosphoglycolate phosphatase
VVRLVVYDLDGTLVDTLEDITASANAMLAALGEPAIGAGEVRRYIGRGLPELIRQCLKTDDPDRLKAGARAYKTHYREHLLDRSRLYPGADMVLRRFTGRRQAVLTNKPNPFTRELLRGLGIEQYFADVIAGDSAFPKKPDPQALESLMAAHGAPGQATLFIGDSPIDVETGRRAGARTAAVLHGLTDEQELRAARPDVVVADFRELLARADAEGW